MKKVSIFIIIAALSLPGFAKKLASLPKLARPTWLTIDGNQFYVAEKATIHIYSMKDFSLKKKFGREGEGPKEFRISPIGPTVLVFPLQDTLMIASLGKVSFFSKDGKFIKEYPTRLPGLSIYQPFGKGYVGLGADFDQETQSAFNTFNLYDENLKKLKEIYRQKTFHRGRFEFPQRPSIFFVVGDKILVSGEDGFVLINIDAEGNKETFIKREYEKVKMTETYKEWVLKYFRTHPLTAPQYDTIKRMIKFPNYFPVIQFFVTADQKVYIMTYLKEAGRYETFIYDLKGKFLKRVFLPYSPIEPLFPAPFDIKNNKFYHLIDNEETEEWELHAEEIE